MSNLFKKCCHIVFKYVLPYNFVVIVFKNKKMRFFPFWIAEIMPVLPLTGGIYHYWAISFRFVLYHILIKTKWTCPLGSQDKWLDHLLPLTCATSRADFCLRARQQAGLDSSNTSTTSCCSGNTKPLNPWALLQSFLFVIYILWLVTSTTTHWFCSMAAHLHL